jgi:long-subunit fatty acid transport protein
VRRFPLALGVSYSAYAARDFTVATTDTLTIRESPEQVFDSVSSRGGVSDLRVAASYRVGTGWAVGGGFHVLTGSNRLQFRRTFEDSAYLPVAQRSEISYAGVGASVGTIRQFGSRLTVAAMARSDGSLDVDLDSTRVSDLDLPYTLGLGVRYRVGTRLELATQGLFRTWSGANSDLLEAGAPGAQNTVELSFGGEYVNDPRRPFRRPIRFGARYGTLPFPLTASEQPSEFAVSLGTGTRFAQQRGGIDIAVEHVWRSAAELKERAFLVTVGVIVRP